ncbi:MAG TPA: ribbon-helix-helix protein, CopG family [Solirubrobacterales bacterium]|nr:ribbon-helix-helix protein, CopG family [Solirubrobacterales bacterium]
MAKVNEDDEKKLYTRDGVEVTDEMAEAWADEAERGYDVSKLRRQYVGRPSLGRQGISPRISFRAPDDLFKKAQKRADKEERSLSDLAREALTRYLEK